MEKFKLPVHEHPLYRVGGNRIHGNSTYGWLLLSCHGCYGEGHMDDGYRCSQCPEFYLHKKCGESTPEINHPSHPEHSLKLLAGPQCSGQRCHLCGVNSEVLCYHCSICDFTLDTRCAINPPLPIIKQPKAHEHTLTLMSRTDTDFTCHLCGGNRYSNMYVYFCSLCDFFVHIECVSFSPEINYPFHPRHQLKFVQGSSVDLSGNDGCSCSLCGVDIKRQSSYRCSICNFMVDLKCVKNPPPAAFVSSKTHKHELTLMPRNITFVCNACGTEGDRSPYVCSRCNFMIHWYCVDLPGTICINRHDHPLSHTYDHDFGNWSQQCGVCRKTMDSSYGAYSCSKKCKYAVHSRCATKTYVWDGRDIEGEPEEIEDVAPFKVIGDNLITHFTHEEHDMKLMKDGSVDISCKACVAPIGSQTFYECMQCDFILHERCANLPRKISHVLLPEKFVLVGGASYFHDTFRCLACERYSSGFRYKNGPGEIIDLQCISISEPLIREAHHHPLYYFSEKTVDCKTCCLRAYFGFECLENSCGQFINRNYNNLHFKCAIFPERVMHKSDDHTLRLYYPGFLMYDPNIWCDICEKRVDYVKPYYTCDECGTTLHIKCVLGDLFGSISPGSIITHQEVKYDRYSDKYDVWWEYEFQVISNIGIVRPLCCVCHSRCTFSLVLKTHDNLDRYVCSYDCLAKFHPTKNSA